MLSQPMEQMAHWLRFRENLKADSKNHFHFHLFAPDTQQTKSLLQIPRGPQTRWSPVINQTINAR